MNHIKSICKDPFKVDQKLQGKEFLLGKYFNLKSKCSRCKKIKKFPKSQRQKLLQIQDKINCEDRAVQLRDNMSNNENKIIQQKDESDKIKQICATKQQQHILNSTNTSNKNYRYEYFLPLHKLWKCYMNDLLQGQKNEQSACLKILRSDFVGAQIQVVYSKINSYIGHKGIVIKETLKTFVVIKDNLNLKENYTANQGSITNEDSIKQSNAIKQGGNANSLQAHNQNTFPHLENQKRTINLLKNQIIFKIQIGQKTYLLNGNTLVYRPSDRSKHKFKFRPSQKINLNFLDLFLNQ